MYKTAFISHSDTLLHVMDGSHPESPARITAIKEAVAGSSLHKDLTYINAPFATKEQVQRVHAKEYVDYIHNIAPKAGLVRLDGDTAMGPASLEATLRASGAVVKATDMVMQGLMDRAFCCTRPPGHHAGVANSAGFCIFNHIAIGVAHAITQYDLKRIAIVDFDVHHGDGTEDIFKNNPSVMLLSSFQHPYYPHSGEDSLHKNVIKIPLAAQSDGKVYREQFAKHFKPALESFKPEIIFVSAGFDAHMNDPLAHLMLNNEDYQWITDQLSDISVKHCKNRLISCLEGGYHLQSIASACTKHLQSLIKHAK